tara:strand:- start:18 stop:215 length:198 start_codon:yes stop_codon:yes gene_type:complete
VSLRSIGKESMSIRKERADLDRILAAFNRRMRWFSPMKAGKGSLEFVSQVNLLEPLCGEEENVLG